MEVFDSATFVSLDDAAPVQAPLYREGLFRRQRAHRHPALFASRALLPVTDLELFTTPRMGYSSLVVLRSPGEASGRKCADEFSSSPSGTPCRSALPVSSSRFRSRDVQRR